MQKKLTAIYVDDDEREIEFFTHIAEKEPLLHIVATFKDAEEAYRFVKENKVDVVFTDIEMPARDGLWLARKLQDDACMVIFVTSYSGYAIDAFEVCALDYLLKPIAPKKIADSLNRYQAKISKGNFSDQLKELKEYLTNTQHLPKRLYISTVGKIVVVNLQEIMYLTASNTYTRIKMNQEEIISSKNLRLYAEALEHHPDFIRIHRSHIVNKEFVKFINRDLSKFSVTMTDNTELEISQNKKNEVFKMLTK